MNINLKKLFAADPGVPAKSKIAAWIIIVSGVLFFLFMAYSFPGAVKEFGLKTPMHWGAHTVSVMAFEALGIAVMSLIVGLMLFKQKKRVFVFAAIIFLLAYAFLFILVKASASTFTQIITPCLSEESFIQCTGKLDVEGYNNSTSLAFVATVFPILGLCWIVLAVIAGLMILRRNKAWWVFGVGMSALIFLYGIIPMIGYFVILSVDDLIRPDVLISAVVLILLLLDSKAYLGIGKKN